MQDAEDWLDVEAVECAGVRQRPLFVTNVEGAIGQPDICLNRDCAYRKGAVKRERTPIVVVTMERLGDDALCEVRWVGV